MFGHAVKDPVKEQKLSPKEFMAQQVDHLENGQDLTFKLGPIYKKPFVVVTRNPNYPGKGKKFSVSQDDATPDGRPSGSRGTFFDTNNAKDVASWVVDRGGHVYES